MKLQFKIIAGLLILGLSLFGVFWKNDIPVETLKQQYTNEQSLFMELNGMQVHYRDEGSGVPLVLIHGTAASLHTWNEWTNILKKDFRIIRMDLPAFGLTGPSPDRDYAISSYIDFLNEFLANLGVDTFYLAGNSLGGQIAWNYALLNQPRVKKLILLDAAGFPKEPPMIIKLAQSPVAAKVLKNITPRFLIRKNLEEVYGDDAKISEELVERYYLLSLREGNRQGFIDRVSGGVSSDTRDLSKIRIPVLIQWGEEDIWIPLEHGEEFNRSLPNSKLLVYPGVGHIPMEEIPEKTARDAMNFLL